VFFGRDYELRIYQGNFLLIDNKNPGNYAPLSNHTHPFNGPLSGTTQVSRYQKGKTNLDFTGARDSEWQWHQLGHMQICTSLQTDNHASTSLLMQSCTKKTFGEKGGEATKYFWRSGSAPTR